MQAEGHYYDGKRSECHMVILSLNDDRLQITGDGIDLSWPLKEVRVSAPLGSMKRSAYLPDGGKCDFDDNAFAQLAEQYQGKGSFFQGVHRWENSLKRAFVALTITIVLVLGFIQFGIPVLAEQAAYAIPTATETTLGRETLQILDRTLFAPTELNTERQAELEQLFAVVISSLDATERPYMLELRSSPKIGANAFALPGGTVIMTDELVEMAGSDEEVAAVLAHEVGHVRHRHAMRQVIQGSAVGLVIATLTGDIFSATSMAAALPTMLVDAKFSRDMELQADDVAVEYLVNQGDTVEHFAAILTRMEQSFAEKHGTDAGENRTANYFSSHPATGERIERLNRRMGQ
jgi:Zn-dependent protease with chaperone function